MVLLLRCKMKRIAFLLFALLAYLNNTFSQLETHILPTILDAEKAIFSNYSDVIRPKFIPPLNELSKGPERILTSSGIEIINIVNSGGGQSETFISRHPFDRNIIVASANDMRYNTTGYKYRMAAYYSTDGGKNWSTSLTPPNQDVYVPTPSGGGSGMTNVDPGLAFDSKGNVYYSYIFTQVSDQGSIEDGGVFMNKSTDGGKTWNDPIPVSLSVGGGSNQDAHDKPFIACDANPNSPFKNRIYVTWYLISPTLGGTIGFAYSADGEEFSPTTRVPGSVGSGGVQSPMPIVASDGTLYVVWENKNGVYTNIMLQKSTNGGVSWVWSSPKQVQTVKAIGEKVNLRMALPNKGNMRVSSYPYIALGNSPNNLYVVQAGKDDNDHYGIYFAKSTNGGESWINNIRVDNNPYRNDMFFPAIAYDEATGILAISYYSSSMDSSNKAVDLFVAISFDNGNSWKNIRVTPQSWYLDHSNAVIDAGGASLGRYWGDYLSIVAYNGKVVPCFWMPNGPRGTFFSNNAYVAILTTAPKPPDSLRYLNSYQEPNKVVLYWLDPKENLLGGTLGNFKIWVFRNGNKIAEVNKGTQTYTDASLTDGETYTYALKVVEESGLESPLVSITFVAGGSLEPNAPQIISARPNEGGILLDWVNPSQHIDGSFFHDYESLEVYAGSQLLYTIQKQDLITGEAQTKVLPLPTRKFYKIKIRAVGKRGDRLTPSLFSDEILAYSGAPLNTLNENFDDTSKIIPFYTDGTTGKWGIASNISNTPPNCITDSPSGNYQPKSNNYFILAPVILRSPNLTLSFEEIAIIDSLGDIGIISVSKDFGKTWTDVAWIDQKRSPDFKDNVGESKWFSEHRTLKTFEDDTVFIKFTLVSTPLRNKDGWYIDNIRLDDDINSIEELTELPNNFELEVFPNPANSELHITFTLKTYTNYTIQIVDALGNVISSEDSYSAYVGEKSTKFNLDGISSGVYLARAIVKGYTKVVPFVVLK